MELAVAMRRMAITAVVMMKEESKRRMALAIGDRQSCKAKDERRTLERRLLLSRLANRCTDKHAEIEEEWGRSYLALDKARHGGIYMQTEMT